jgi:hypothetical protein
LLCDIIFLDLPTWIADMKFLIDFIAINIRVSFLYFLERVLLLIIDKSLFWLITIQFRHFRFIQTTYNFYLRVRYHIFMFFRKVTGWSYRRVGILLC